MTDHLARIAELNDRVRLGLDRDARVVMTATCLAALAGDGRRSSEAIAQAAVLAAIRRYAFASEAGPERDRGEFTLGATTIRFKIDYYDRSLDWGSENPADPSVTVRVMTIMLPEDD